MPRPSARRRARELAAIACASEASAQAAREAYPQARVHRDWRALVADPSLEAVDIVVPNHLHAEIGDRGARRRQGRAARETDGEHDRRMRPNTRGGAPHRSCAERRPRVPHLDAMGVHQAPHRGGRDRRTALRQCEPVPLSLPPGLRRLALRPGHRRLLDSRGAGAFLRHADVVVRRSGRPGERAGLRQFEGARRRRCTTISRPSCAGRAGRTPS